LAHARVRCSSTPLNTIVSPSRSALAEPERATFAALRGTPADGMVDYFLDAKTPAGNPRYREVRWGGAPGLASVSTS
jgi:hypothetical protein